MVSGTSERVSGSASPAAPAATGTPQERSADRRPVLWRELLLGLAVFGVYSIVAGLDWAGRSATAAAHARAVFDLERTLHLDIEPSLNAWLAPHAVLRTLANYEYAITYVISAFVLLFWIYARRPDVYRWARTSFVLLNLVAVGCFALYPLTPPRLVPEQGFVDTVRLGHTVGSWGSPLVDHANQLAAMPSLHVAWAFWVSVVLALIAGGWRTQLLSGVHVLLTVLVVMATANHYLLDAVGGAVLVYVCVALAGALTDRPGEDATRGTPVPAADAFFLHVESRRAPQHVGGVVLLDGGGRPGAAPDRDDVVAVIQEQLGHLPRFRQRLSDSSSWRRARWVDHPDLDWDWHVPVRDLTGPAGEPGGVAALYALVAEIAATPLPRDRPLWRLVLVHGVTEQHGAVVLVVHHVIADGIGAVAQALHLFEAADPEQRHDGRHDPRPRSSPSHHDARPGALRVAAATAIGLAQLATDGPARGRLPGNVSAQRCFGTTELPLADVRAVARAYDVRVSDVLLCAVAGGLSRVLSGGNTGGLSRLRVAVPLMVRDPGASTEGNLTAAVMIDLPFGPRAEPDRLTEVARGSDRLRSGTRAVASRFVMQVVGELLPPVVHAWFARTVYGARFFHAIVSNMPGPDVQLTLAGARLGSAFPILPLAPGVPLAVGALGWHGSLCVGISTDPAAVPDIDALARAVEAVFDDLRRAAPAACPPSPARAGGGLPSSGP